MLRIHILINHCICSTHQAIILCVWLSLVGLLNSKTLHVEMTKALALCLHLLFYVSKQSHSVLSLNNLYTLMGSILLFSDKTFFKIYILNQFLHVCNWICNCHCKLYVSQCTLDFPFILCFSNIPHFIKRHSTYPVAQVHNSWSNP